MRNVCRHAITTASNAGLLLEHGALASSASLEVSDSTE